MVWWSWNVKRLKTINKIFSEHLLKTFSISAFIQSSPEVFIVSNVLVSLGLTLPSSGQHGLSSGLHSTIHGLRLGFICRGLLGYLHGLFGVFYDYSRRMGQFQRTWRSEGNPSYFENLLVFSVANYPYNFYPFQIYPTRLLDVLKLQKLVTLPAFRRKK